MKLKERAPRNRTIVISNADRIRLRSQLIKSPPKECLTGPLTGTICGDYRTWVKFLPESHVDVLFLDPPYNLDKCFNGHKFSRQEVADYTEWLDNIIVSVKPLLRPTATIYICGDWFTSISIYEAASRHFAVRNRITWEREKGRGAKTNWKNASEDIWFCTVSNDYKFNVDEVKIRRKVLAPYTHENGEPKDWVRAANGNFRDTHPSNLWTDITIPFWSMPENTDHPTQKSEKLLAKMILASSDNGDFVFDPFLGSGTTSVVAKKLGRKYLGIEIDEEYCLLALRRLELAGLEAGIQGYSDGVFWERNSVSAQRPSLSGNNSPSLFSE